MTQAARSSASDLPGHSGPGETGNAGSETARFWLGLPAFARFGGIMDQAAFTPLPDDWTVGIADVEASTSAITAGHYKRVNTAGASVISAVSNALGHLDFPFLFSGDGASFAVGPDERGAATEALAATVAWVGAELELPLRGATLPVGEIRASGSDVRVARFAASPNASYAMFAGGGLAWAEARMKAGTLAATPAPPGARPDLTGLSCRFHVHRAKHGIILSVMVRPSREADDPAFATVIGDVLAMADAAPDGGRPLPRFEPRAALGLEANRVQGRLHRKPGESRAASTVRALTGSAAVAVIFGTGASVGAFSAKRYIRHLVENSDFRKYDDGLLLTLDCSAALADGIEDRLRRAEAEGVARYGLHRQEAATVTCVVPSATRPNHVHFIDGASGGYAFAARAFKPQPVAPEGS